MSAFEQSLWARLVAECDADQVMLSSPRRGTRKRPTMLTAGATALAAATAAAVFLVSATTSTPPAYALTRNHDGSLTVTIHNLATATPQLNARFKRLGIDETVIPVRATCPTKGLIDYPGARMAESLTFYPHHAYLARGWAGVLSAEQLPHDRVALTIGAMKPPLPSCFSNIPLTSHLP